MYRGSELVYSRLLGGARPAEQVVPRNEGGAGARVTPAVSSAGLGARLCAVRCRGLRGANTTVVFARTVGT